MIAIGISTGGLGGGEGAAGDLNSFSAFLVIQGQVFQYICCQGHGYTIVITIPKGHGRGLTYSQNMQFSNQDNFTKVLIPT